MNVPSIALVASVFRGADGFGTSGLKTLSQPIGVGGFVVHQATRLSVRRALLHPHLDRGYFVMVGCGRVSRKRCAIPIGQQEDAGSVSTLNMPQVVTAQSFQYDGLNRVTFARDTAAGNADVNRYYDSLSRVIEEVQTFDGNTCTVTYHAFKSYPPIGFTFPNDRQITSVYSPACMMFCTGERGSKRPPVEPISQPGSSSVLAELRSWCWNTV